MKEIRALSATGILGSGFREDTLKRAMALKPDFIGADSGSTDPGPYYVITIPRPAISGDSNDSDVFGGQQYGPLVTLEVT